MDATTETAAGVLPAILALLGFALFWCVISFVLSRVSGWATLARAYPAADVLTPNARWRWQSVHMNGNTKYSGAVTIVADAHGVHFSMFPVLRAGHARFSVPWPDLHATPRQLLLAQRVVLTFAKAPAVSMLMWPTLADRLAAASQGRFTVTPAPPQS
jgi:hypothetical protein